MTEYHRAWEYHVSMDLSEGSLNQLGTSGWELVSVENGTYYFKRPLPSFREQVTLDQKRRYYALWNVANSEEADR
jgi:hypothetical protein